MGLIGLTKPLALLWLGIGFAIARIFSIVLSAYPCSTVGMGCTIIKIFFPPHKLSWVGVTGVGWIGVRVGGSLDVKGWSG